MNKHELRITKNNQNKGCKKIDFVELNKSEFSKLSQDVFLFEHCPIIAMRNKKDMGVINGEKFVITDFDDENIYARRGEKKITILKTKFQSSFHVAFCITAHKSQGQTVTQRYTIYDWQTMPDKCKYVSLSRSSLWENVSIKN